MSVTVRRQVAMLLQRAGVLRQSASTRDHHDLWPHATQVCLPYNAQAAAGQVPCREGQDAARETDTCPYALSTVDDLLISGAV